MTLLYSAIFAYYFTGLGVALFHRAINSVLEPDGYLETQSAFRRAQGTLGLIFLWPIAIKMTLEDAVVVRRLQRKYYRGMAGDDDCIDPDSEEHSVYRMNVSSTKAGESYEEFVEAYTDKLLTLISHVHEDRTGEPLDPERVSIRSERVDWRPHRVTATFRVAGEGAVWESIEDGLDRITEESKRRHGATAE